MTVVDPICAAPVAIGGRVAGAMVRTPKRCHVDTTVAQARETLRDDHVHAVLLVDGARLIAVVERADLLGAAPQCPARSVGRLDGRVVAPDADLALVHGAMLGRRRRLAVVDHDGRLLGLLCLKRSGTGFCSDDDVAARAAEFADAAAADVRAGVRAGVRARVS